MNKENVCFVAEIEEIRDIPSADNLVQAIISGWECVITKDKFDIGDKVVIAVVDAVIPQKLAESLGILGYLKHRKKTNQYTVKAVKLRGVYSMATIISTMQEAGVTSAWAVGDDQSVNYGITKYEEPVEQVTLTDAKGKKVRYSKNPNFHVYHKFPNAKNAPNMFEEGEEVVITNKLHGANWRAGIVKKSKLSLWEKFKKFIGIADKWIEYDFVYGSHNVEKGSSSQHYYSSDIWKEIVDRYGIKEKLWNEVKRHKEAYIGDGFILYGEIYGPGIQKYYDYGFKNPQLALFDIKIAGDYIGHRYFTYWAEEFNIPTVGVLYEGPFSQEIVEKFQNNRFISTTKTPEEGIVVKSITGDRNKIAKYINPAYLEFQSKKEDSTDFH